VKPVYAPQTQATALLRYEWGIPWGGKMSVGGDAEYVSSFYYNLRNFDADKYPASFTLNAGVGWKNDNLAVNFKVRNVTDVRSGVQGFDLAGLCGCNEVSYKPPRFFELETRYSF
jgi:iron complex outermembrane recepter protein